MSGPSSQVSPAQRSESRMIRSDAADERCRAVSSMRRVNSPPCLRATIRVIRATWAVPTCGPPVREGATRVRTVMAVEAQRAGPEVNGGWITGGSLTRGLRHDQNIVRRMAGRTQRPDGQVAGALGQPAAACIPDQGVVVP